jgi:very-short-patch-repair endonuclease
VSPLLPQLLEGLLIKKDLPLGTSLENKVTWQLSGASVLERFQYRVGRYRLDYAWPDLMVALEADGPHHMRPDVAARDAYRDAELRAQGWLVFRVDNAGGNLEEQVCRVARTIHQLRYDSGSHEGKRRRRKGGAA